jgi:hypothetical protein
MLRASLISLLILGATSAHSATGVPYPPNCSVNCVRACPRQNNQWTYVELRDSANNPVNHATVVIDFSDCPTFVHCPPETWGWWFGYTWDPVARAASNVTGWNNFTIFHLKGGGVGPRGSVRVYAEGVFLSEAALFSPDQDGDLVAGTSADLAILLSKVGTADPTGDLDCDGVVTDWDVTQFSWHSGHVCEPPPTETQRRSWGSLKQIYR